MGSGEEAPDQLLANPSNWRVHPKAQQQALAGILGQVGWVQQVLVNRRTGHVVDGHLRVALATQGVRADRPGPVRRPRARGGGARPRQPRPAGGDGRHRRREAPGAARGRRRSTPRRWPRCSPSSRRRATKAGQTDPDDIPAPPDEATTKPGDLWLLGDHRLLCGDAGSVADLDRLLDGAQVVAAGHRPALQREGRAAQQQRHRRRALLVPRRPRPTTRRSTSRGIPRRRRRRTGSCAPRTARSRTTS